jgi:hypothetical protein
MKSILEYKDAIRLSTSYRRSIKKIVTYILLLLFVCNIPPVTGILTSFLVSMKGIPFGFVTKDLHYATAGGLKTIKKSDSYKEYKRRYPMADHTLYRVNPTKDYSMFWRYLEYATNPNWRAPFIELPSDFTEVPYYGSDINRNPRYRWNEETETWDKLW